MSQVRQSKSDNSLRKEDHEDPDIAQKGLLIYFFPKWSIKIISVTEKLNLSQGFSLASATCLQKTGSETGFLAQILDRLLDRDVQGRTPDRKAEQVFKTETGYLRQSF